MLAGQFTFSLVLGTEVTGDDIIQGGGGEGNMVLLLAQADTGFYFITKVLPGPRVDIFFNET